MISACILLCTLLSMYSCMLLYIIAVVRLRTFIRSWSQIVILNQQSFVSCLVILRNSNTLNCNTIPPWVLFQCYFVLLKTKFGVMFNGMRCFCMQCLCLHLHYPQADYQSRTKCCSCLRTKYGEKTRNCPRLKIYWRMKVVCKKKTKNKNNNNKTFQKILCSF